MDHPTDRDVVIEYARERMIDAFVDGRGLEAQALEVYISMAEKLSEQEYHGIEESRLALADPWRRVGVVVDDV